MADGSTDGIARKIAKRFASPVRHSFQPHHGLGAARNHGMRMARGRFICVVYFIDCLRDSGASATKADHFNLSEQAQPVV
jgi:glycosyltransferase involved in cell wall biosynthesis